MKIFWVKWVFPTTVMEIMKSWRYGFIYKRGGLLRTCSLVAVIWSLGLTNDKNKKKDFGRKITRFLITNLIVLQVLLIRLGQELFTEFLCLMIFVHIIIALY